MPYIGLVQQHFEVEQIYFALRQLILDGFHWGMDSLIALCLHHVLSQFIHGLTEDNHALVMNFGLQEEILCTCEDDTFEDLRVHVQFDYEGHVVEQLQSLSVPDFL